MEKYLFLKMKLEFFNQNANLNSCFMDIVQFLSGLGARGRKF